MPPFNNDRVVWMLAAMTLLLVLILFGVLVISR
jgi:hypothetical protein